MSTESHWKEMANSVLAIFSNKGTISMDELDYLMSIALKDNLVDEKEKKVLKGVFAQVTKETVEPEVWNKIEAIKSEYEID